MKRKIESQNLNIFNFLIYFVALRGCGKNPTHRSVDTYWRTYKSIFYSKIFIRCMTTYSNLIILKGIGLEEFYEIANQENTITERDLLEAFKAIDVNDNGYVSFNEFLALLTREGDAMDPRQLRKIMEDADLNQDKNINYKEVHAKPFLHFILS
jgi:Ca2+-binding EF-hand superfamily protein